MDAVEEKKDVQEVKEEKKKKEENELDNLDEVLKDIFSGKDVVVVTGAGVSVPSGIKPFRGEGGLYEEDKDAPDKLSLDYLIHHPEDFYEFYLKNMMMEGYEPNVIHRVLARMEELGLIKGIITQNVDGLHQDAGSKNVVEIHGNGSDCFCMTCRKVHSMDEYKESDRCRRKKETLQNIPDNEKELCPGTIRPSITLYGEEPLPEKIRAASKMLLEADVVLVLGTSLTVGTITGLLWNDFLNKGTLDKGLYILNKDETWMDKYAKVYHGDLEDVFEQIGQVIDQFAGEKSSNEEKAIQKVKTMN